ncbi:MAG: N-6 DNA methylase, partial [Fibrella sp.]|nr:N-6 DNA methylase [Armatimonadota bacterium]
SRFDWRTASYELRVPMIRALFYQVADPTRLAPLGLMEVLDRAGEVLNRVDRAAFFARFEQDAAVQYFYEPFLEAFDPQLRKELGVWYTPREIVQYQVERVDRALRDELGIADGLADERVYVLDPCCGTGAYAVEVLKRIHKTLQENGGGDGLGGTDLKKAAINRIFGFEILPAPFVIAHLQLGLLLQNLGAPLSDEKEERVGVYLTNALTGWAPTTEEGQRRVVQLAASYPELGQEHDAAEQIKREKPILVVLGNPPYNAFSGVAEEQENGLVDAYKVGLSAQWGIRKFNLDDLYVRFFRLAERRVAGSLTPGEGVVCFISNASYLGDPSFVVMRQRMLDGFDSLYFDNLNGDSRETGKTTPDGQPDPSVFSTATNREGIRVGTAVGLMVRKKKEAGALPREPVVRYREFWGAAKRAELLESLDATGFDAQYTDVKPSALDRFSFKPQLNSPTYRSWPSVGELCSVHPFNGPVERRGNALISIERDALENRMERYFDGTFPDDDVARLHPSLLMTGNRIVGPDARRKLIRTHFYEAGAVTRYPFRPFDVRWSYLANIRPLFSEPSPELLRQRFPGNTFLVVRETSEVAPGSPPFYWSPLVCDYHLLQFEAKHIPIFLMPKTPTKQSVHAQNVEGHLFEGESLPEPQSQPYANLSGETRKYLTTLGCPNPDNDAPTAELIWLHTLAIGFAPSYLGENGQGIKVDWPRIPLPSTRDVLEASAALGRKVADILNTELPAPGVTAGKVASGLATVARSVRADDSKASINPDAGDLTVTAGWGSKTKMGIMPGRGDARLREYTPEERAALTGDGTHGAVALSLLGEKTYDIHLNDKVCWANVPAAVWEYTIGGYQVVKKWLSYRENSVLGRGLTTEEAREVRDMARRIASLLLLAPDLDANYAAIKGSTYAWPHADTDGNRVNATDPTAPKN